MAQDARQIEEENTIRRARLLAVTYFDTSQNQDKQLFNDVLSTGEMYDLKIVPIYEDDNNITFGITTNTSQTTINDLRHRFSDQRVGFVLISDTGYREYMRLFDPPKKIEYTNIEINTAGNDELVARVSQTLESVKADDMLAYLVQQAHQLNASDIHLETQKDFTRIRFRIDGVLHIIARLTSEKYRILIAAIASAGNVSTSAADAQQGHIAQEVSMATGEKVDVNVRLETVPTVNGMDVVMRLFNMDQSMYNLDRLGLSEQERSVIDDIIKKPSGLVMVVGPTGSGKTTTLYSMLNTLNTDERKIITVEDPVEYRFAGIAQLSVTSQNSQESNFADKLRAILRLDPDIIMVGEIRDMDTAKTALQASLTGHLVLSTFHASSASAALTRLIDVIGMNPLFVSSIRLVMAQRLVRRLDPETKIAYQPDEQTINKIHQIFETLHKDVPKPDIANLTLYKPGSSASNPYGYKGQIALREQFLMSGKIRELLESGKAASAPEIEEAAIASGMRTMLQDAIIKVVQGETTLEEVFRVIG